MNRCESILKSEEHKKPLLLIVDDDEAIRSQMRWALADEYEILEAGDRPSSLNIVHAKHPTSVLLDLGLPPNPREAIEGLTALREILEVDPGIKIIMITGNTEKSNALKAIDLGAFDFFSKPPVMEEVRVVLKRAFRMAELEGENNALRRQMETDGLEGILGTSPPMQEIFQTIRKVATVDVPVLILGESGTGKELAARAIHRLSHRREGPFTIINCGVIPENLLESELFGHEKGSFTGADTNRKGRIEYANGGTLLLDEIGELSLSLQVKLLRFLQDHIIDRIGGREEIPVDVRILAATNRDLQNEVKAGKFREDLYFRLGVITCEMPPLRLRGNDLFLLAKIFLHRLSDEIGKRIRGFKPDALESIADHPWPGNIRELENRIKRAVVMSEGEWIDSEDLNFRAKLSQPDKLPNRLQRAREMVDRELIQRTLEANKGIILKAAEELGISRQYLAELIRKYNLSKVKE